MSLGFGYEKAFEEYIQRAHNPRFVSVSRQTTTRDLEKYFLDRRYSLIECLKSVNSVCLTSDIWSSNAKEDYLSVVIHFVSADWEIEKRVIGLRLIDVSHSGVNITDRVESVVTEFGLKDKVFLSHLIMLLLMLLPWPNSFQNLLVTLVLTLIHLTIMIEHCVVFYTRDVHVTL